MAVAVYDARHHEFAGEIDDESLFRPVIEMQIKAWGISVGRRHGFAYAEEFRRARFGGIERWARDSGAQLPDDL